VLDFIPDGFDAPFLWIRIKWTIIITIIRRGRIKCNEKNRDRVGLSTEYPPHSHLTSVGPI
jgi:hypothetical protein